MAVVCFTRVQHQVKALYKDLDLQAEFAQYEDKSYVKIKQLIDEVSSQ
jgi:hypothetical protein